MRELEIHESTDSCYLEAVFCLAKSILSPASLKTCPAKYNIKYNGFCCAFESNQHEIAGSVVKYVVNLIWECFLRLSKGIALDASQDFECELRNLVQIVNVCCGHPLAEALLAEAVKRQIFSVFWMKMKECIILEWGNVGEFVAPV